MTYKIIDGEGKEHLVHTGKPVKDITKVESGIVLCVQVEDTQELWELYDGEKDSILGVLNVAYADQGEEIHGWAVMRIVAGVGR